MSLNEIDRQLRALVSTGPADPERDAQQRRVDTLQQQEDALAKDVVAARQQIAAAELVVTEAIADGAAADERTLIKAQNVLAVLEPRARLVTRARTDATRRLAELDDARHARIQAALRPLLAAAVAEYEQRALAVIEVDDVLALAYDVACRLLPDAAQRGGLSGLLTRDRLGLWQARCAGLLPSTSARVA